METEWMRFAKRYAKKHGISYAEALTHATCMGKYMKTKMK